MTFPRLSFPRRLRFASALAALLWVASSGRAPAGGIVTTAPVEDFRLPLFAPDGSKRWELRAHSGVYGANDRVDLVDMRLRVFQPSQPEQVEVEITSPLARVHYKERRAEGPTAIALSGPGFQVQGQDWTWDGVAGRVVMRRGVRAVFQEDLANLIR